MDRQYEIGAEECILHSVIRESLNKVYTLACEAIRIEKQIYVL